MFGAGCVRLYRLKSLILFQGIAMPAFIANTSAGLIAMFEMPAFCNRDFHSSSLSVSTSFSIRADDSPPLMMLLTVCINFYCCFEGALQHRVSVMSDDF